MSTTQPVQPIRESVIGAIRNAAQIASGHAESGMVTRQAYYDIARLLAVAIEGLSEPSAAAIQAASVMLRDADMGYDNDGHITSRAARDAAAVILQAQLTGNAMIQHWSGGDWEYSDDCGCERCVDFRKLPRVAPLEYSHCSRCKEPVDFIWDAEEKDWLSECCGAPAVPVDLEPSDGYKPGLPF